MLYTKNASSGDKTMEAAEAKPSTEKPAEAPKEEVSTAEGQTTSTSSTEPTTTTETSDTQTEGNPLEGLDEPAKLCFEVNRTPKREYLLFILMIRNILKKYQTSSVHKISKV